MTVKVIPANTTEPVRILSTRSAASVLKDIMDPRVQTVSEQHYEETCFCICENKGADQLSGDCKPNQTKFCKHIFINKI